MKQILLIEDDPILGKSLYVTLEIAGYGLRWGKSLHEARNLVNSKSADLVILDINLPDGSGLTFAQECKVKFPQMPVLMLTASNDEATVIAGFEAGAVDYVRKPFSNEELKARIRLVLKENTKEVGLSFGGLSVLLEKRRIEFAGSSFELNRREFDILVYLVKRAENVVTRENLLKVLDKDGEIFDRTIDSHVSHLRTSLRKFGITAVQISSVYGIGYRLEKKID